MVVLSILEGRGRLETPVEEVAGVESDAKQIGGDESELRSERIFLVRLHRRLALIDSSFSGIRTGFSGETRWVAA